MKWVSSWCWWIDSCKVSLKASHPWSLWQPLELWSVPWPRAGCAESCSLLWSLSLGQWCLCWPWFSNVHTRTGCPLGTSSDREGSREGHQQPKDMLKFFSAFLEGFRWGKSCKKTGEKLAVQWREETNVGVREGRAEGIPLTLTALGTAQHCSHTRLNWLGNLSRENVKSENLKRVLEERYNCRATWSTALRSSLRLVHWGQHRTQCPAKYLLVSDFSFYGQLHHISTIIPCPCHQVASSFYTHKCSCWTHCCSWSFCLDELFHSVWYHEVCTGGW